MFVAQRELKVVSRGENPVTKIYRPGDVIPDFADWDIHARRSHINLEWVREEEKAPAKSKSEERRLKIVGLEPEKKPAKKEAAPKKTAQTKKAVAATDCEDCGKSFKSEKAKKTHRTLAHK